MANETDKLVTVDRLESGVAVITLRNPKVNALSAALLRELEAEARALVDDPPGAVVLTGGERVFAAGADITEFGSPEEARATGGLFTAAAAALESIPRVTIASIAGFALGGGLEIALACDLRIAADSARVGLPEILLGILPGGGGTQRLPRLIGPGRAKEIIFSGRQVRMDEAASIGLVNRVVPADDLATETMAWAESFASGAILAQGLAKQAIDDGLGGTLAEGIAVEADVFEEVFRTEDSRTGIASFLEHGPGKATFAGR